MLLAFALVGLVLLLSQFLFSPSSPSKSGATQNRPATADQAVKPQPGVPPAPSQAKAAETTAGQPPTGISASREQSYTVDTKVYRVTFSNRGAVVSSWLLKDYKDSNRKELELVNAAAAGKTQFPLSFLFESQKPSADLNQALYAASQSPDGLGITFEYSNGKSWARKTIKFARDSYLLDITSEIREGEAGVPHLLAWRGGFGDRGAYAAAASIKTLYFDVSANKLVEHEAKEAKDGPATTSGTYSFGGIEDTYFLGVFLPRENRSLKLQTISDSVSLMPGEGEQAVAGVGVGGDARNDFSLFVGPKDLDLLRRVNPKLAGAVDFGWFSILASPIFVALNWLNDHWFRNYGWSIIVLTVLINMVLLPLKLSGMKGMKRMSALQPEVQAINEKYKSISMRDPRKAEQNQEIMELYKRHGVNPLGAGCMPLLLQIPFFFAFYKVLSVAIELRGADWLWIRDLSNFDPWYLLPVVMVVTQFLLQKMTPNTSADPAQQKMMLFMPLVFGFLFFKSPAGLVLYWLTGNLVSILQQWFINRITPPPAPAAAVVTASRPAGKKKR